MPAFVTTSYTAEGKHVRGVVQAASVEEASRILRSRKQFPISVKAQRQLYKNKTLKLSTEEQITLFTHLELQLSNNVDAVQAIYTLKDRVKSPRLRYVLREMHDQLTSSRSNLTEAFRSFPKAFPIAILTVIEAGEETATLADRFKDLRERIEYEANIRRAIVSAVQYPAFTGFFALALIIYFMSQTVPLMARVLKELGAELPAVTVGVIQVSDWFSAYWIPLSLFIVAIPVTIRILRKYPKPGLVIDTLLLRVPVIGEIYKYLAAALLARVYCSLYLADKPAIQALEICSKLVSNHAISANISHAINLVKDGSTLANAFEKTNAMPGEACAIVASGESGGTLDIALIRIADFYSTEAKRTIGIFTTWLGPLLIVVLGGTIGVVLISMIIPIFKITSSIH